MIILNQPFNGQLGEILKKKIGAPYTNLTILSAFAKNSGVLRLKPVLEQFKNSHGHIEAFIGVDAHGTSYEAVLNLFELCDELYIVHSESSVTTFHSKAYILSNGEQNEWMAIGSNNLTGGGLWTNFESAVCFDVNPDTSECASELNALVTKYKNPSYNCSRRIESKEDIDTLLSDDYLRREIRMRIDANKEFQNRQTSSKTVPTHRFGIQQGIHIPRMSQHFSETTQQNVSLPVNSQEDFIVTPSDDSETMWFLSGTITGGSSNILDLSKRGKVISGAAEGTRYVIDNSDIILGGVAFFDIPPEHTELTKLVTINFEGTDYLGCEIKFPSSGTRPNGSWRIQLKGISASGIALQNAKGGDWFAHKILIFEKIRTDYYVMSILDENQIDMLTERSRFVAKNGKTGVGRKYGLL